MSPFSPTLCRSHQAEKRRIARTYASRVLRLRMFAVSHSTQRRQGRVPTWFGRDPQYEEKHAVGKANDRKETAPEKCHFAKGYHCGLDIFGRHRLSELEVREAVRKLGHLLLVEGPNDAIRLDTLGVPAFAVFSNRLTLAQADKTARWCKERAA